MKRNGITSRQLAHAFEQSAYNVPQVVELLQKVKDLEEELDALNKVQRNTYLVLCPVFPPKLTVPVTLRFVVRPWSRCGPNTRPR